MQTHPLYHSNPSIQKGEDSPALGAYQYYLAHGSFPGSQLHNLIVRQIPKLAIRQGFAKTLCLELSVI